MEVCAFAIAYFINTVLKIQDVNIIRYIGIAIISVAILVWHNKVVFKGVLLGIALSTIIFNFHKSTENEYALVMETLEFSAIVSEVEQKYDGFSSVIANVTIGDIKFKSKIYFENQDDLLRPNDKITGTAYIYTPSYSSGFDREIYYKANNINVLMSAQEVEIVRSDSFSILRTFSDLQIKIKQNLEQNLNFRSSSFVKALVLGDKSDFDSFFSMDISKVGISHILAVSGMHVGFLANLCMKIVGKKYGGIFAAFFVTIFLFIVGPSPSILRAVIMQYMVIIAWFISRENSGKVSVWVAFVLLLASEPYIMFDVGFILSFMSSISIIYLYQPILQAIKCQNRYVNKYLFSSIAISVSVTATTTFALFYYFGYISTVQILSNLLIIPIITVLFPLCLVYILLGFLGSDILYPLIKIIELLVLITREIIQYIAKFDYVIVDFNILQMKVLCVIIAICALSFWRNKFKRTVIYLSIISFTITGIYASYTSYNDFEIKVFSVGDGQCILVTYKDEVTLIDCGSSEYYTAASLVNEYMYKYSYDRIDNLIITSIDSTHMGDIIWLNYDVENIIYPENHVRADAKEVLVHFIDDRSISVGGKLPDYIKIYSEVDKKLAVKVNDTLILHAFTNLMLEQLTESCEIQADTVVLADKTIGDYYRLQNILKTFDTQNVILSNDYDMLSRVSGFPSKTTAQYGDIVINYGGYYE
ncbi:MAG: ComEC/Rec2 family competence protein [Clostridia bacterium]